MQLTVTVGKKSFVVPSFGGSDNNDVKIVREKIAEDLKNILFRPGMRKRLVLKDC